MQYRISQYNFFIFKAKVKCINFPEVLVAFSVSQKVFCCCCFFVVFFFSSDIYEIWYLRPLSSVK